MVHIAWGRARLGQGLRIRWAGAPMSAQTLGNCATIGARGALRMKRPAQPMPDPVRDALDARGLRAAYDARPWYQRNDYLGWINRAKRPETRLRRLAQMLDELERGDVYMKMAWRPRP